MLQRWIALFPERQGPTRRAVPTLAGGVCLMKRKMSSNIISL